MPIEVVRIDDRLVHGQVVIGWGQPLGLRYLVLVDDGVAANAWEADLYRMGTPPEIELVVRSVAEAAAEYAALDARPEPGMLLAADVGTMDRLTAAVPAIRKVTIGGLHHRQGRDACLPYVFVGADDMATLATIAARGVRIVAQDLPTSREVPLDDLLRHRVGT